MIRQKPKPNYKWYFFIAAGILLVTAILLFQIPSIHSRISWRVEVALTYLRGVFDPAGAMPTPLPQPTLTPGASPTPLPTPTISPTSPATTQAIPTPTSLPASSPTPVPESVTLPSPDYVLQDMNNCGPASLAMYLEYYGWEGTQTDIAEIIKPVEADRNVNVDELVYYVRNYAGWLRAEYRVGGSIPLMEKMIAAGIPVIIEESFYFDEAFWPNDDLWAAHYLLLTGYDQETQMFIAQDSFHGANQRVPYTEIDNNWKIFNWVYIVVYLPSQENTIKTIIGADWDVNQNRTRTLDITRDQTRSKPEDAFTWFNLGTNLAYFEKYTEAAAAYDTARNLGLPQRMLRYQFGPFLAYFHSGRIEDLTALIDYALKRTPNSEEALLWNGWALYRQGNTDAAIESFRKAYAANPTAWDVQYALDFFGVSP
jgi:tetratricopeptide (TPR) repeat protein